jgi:broad-specificity NMP kinase
MSDSSSAIKNLLVTGFPGCGKTTVLERVLGVRPVECIWKAA